MTLTPEQKEHAVSLIEMGDKLDAVRYLQETLNITTDQAMLLTEKLEEEVEQSPLLNELKAFQEQQQKPGVNIGRLVGGIFMGVGAIMLAVVVYLIVSNYKFSQRAIAVPGKVIDMRTHESRDSEGGGSTTMYAPVFEYTFKEKVYTYTSSTSSSSPSYQIGEPVEVLVDPNQPYEAMINSFWEQWFASVLLGIMGSVFFGMGYMAFRVFGRVAKQGVGHL